MLRGDFDLILFAQNVTSDGKMSIFRGRLGWGGLLVYDVFKIYLRSST